MRRTFSAVFVAGLAMLLSVALAAPAAAAGDPWWDYLKNPNAPQYKYSFDYYKRAFRPTQGGQVPTSTKLPVPPTVNPSTSGPAYYLNQYRNRVPSPGSPVLSGKVITPGQTVVRVPSTYGVGGAGASGATVSKLLGGLRLGAFIGAGIGSTSVAPDNRKEIALSKGVSQACVDGSGTCSAAEIKTQFMIDSCGQFTGANSCDSIGGKGSEGQTASKDWFSDEALPFLADLWAKITGQRSSDKPVPPDTFYEVTMSRGCYKSYAVEYRGSNNLTLHSRGEIVASQPGTDPGKTQWSMACSDLTNPTNAAGAGFIADCIDQDGKTVNVANQPYGIAGNLSASSSTWNADGSNKVGMCNTGNNPGKVLTLLRIRLGNQNPQSSVDWEYSSQWSAAHYMEWWNPDANLNTIESTQITTSWTCKTSDGVTYDFVKTVTRTAAAASPSCPAGSALVKHDVTASGDGGQTKTTIDKGGEIPAEIAKYPGCAFNTCTIDVWVDGSKCVVGRTECLNWPAISATSPSRVVCKWGAYAVPTSDCRAISNGYKTEVGVVFDPNSGTWVGVDDYGNPVDANPEPWNPANPKPVPGVDPSTPTTPAPGTGTGTTPNPSPFPGTGTSPADGCVAPAWSWNPVEWVKNPVVCALKEAFVPKTDIQTRSDALKTKAVTTAPIGWVINPPMVGPSGGGCPNWVVSVDGLSKNVVCESSFTAAVVGVRGPLFGIVATAMMWPLLRSIWYALIPIVRVTPSGSK